MSRQDYIVRIRYQNTLPPPPCGPKLLKSKVDFDSLLNAGSLSTLVYSQDLDPVVDQSLGMPIDLIEAPRSFESSMFELPKDPEIDPEDLMLLEDPTAGVPPPTAVAFLRRTEYSSGDMLRGVNSRKSINGPDVETPEKHLQFVEESFEKATVALSELKHPKKNLKAVKSWKFIPDAKQLDLNVKSVRMVGSAALSQNKQVNLSKDQLNASMFTTSQLDHREFATFFAASPQDAPAIVASKRDLQDARDDETFTLDKVQDYELVNFNSKNKFDEVAISLDDTVAYYLPVQSRINLKRRRIESHKQQQAQEIDIDELRVVRTDISPEESIKRDQKRSKYDPVSYE